MVQPGLCPDRARCDTNYIQIMLDGATWIMSRSRSMQYKLHPDHARWCNLDYVQIALDAIQITSRSCSMVQPGLCPDRARCNTNYIQIMLDGATWIMSRSCS